MAEPIEIPACNHTWYGPEGSDIKPLPAILHQNTSTTVWKLTRAELASVLATGCVGVQITGRQPPMAVVALTVEPPPEALELGFALTTDPDAGTQHHATIQSALADVLDSFDKGANAVTIRQVQSPDEIKGDWKVPPEWTEPRG